MSVAKILEISAESPKSFEDAAELSTKLPYPVLLKPRRSNSGEGIMAATNDKEYLTALGRMRQVPVIQEYIEGEDLELTILCIHGEPVAGSTYLSLRNAPLPYGPPVACLSIEDENLMNIGKDFLKKLQVGEGDLVFLMRGKPGSWERHVCRLAGKIQPDGKFQTVGGNAENRWKVTDRTVQDPDLLGFGRLAP